MEDDKGGALLCPYEKLVDKRPDLPPEWKGYEEFIESWREMEPAFEDTESLRPAAFLSRDVMAPSFARVGLSDTALETLAALLLVKSKNSPQGKKLADSLSLTDKMLVMGELVAHLRQQDFSKQPPGIHGAVVLALSSTEAHNELKAFISTLTISNMHSATKFLLEDAKIIEGGK